MNIFKSFYLSYIRELYINFSMRLLLGGSSFDSVPAYPNHFQQVLISSRSCALIRFCGIILISMPIGHWMRTIFGFAGIVTDSFSFANASNSGFFHARTLLSCCLDPLTQSVCFTDGYHEDSFLKGAVPYFIQKSIALFRRFVLIFWNSLISIAITLIVSVTASRRVPRTNRMSLLLPLDSPLSRSYLALRQSFQKKNGFRLFVKPLLYFPSGVCPYLFCDIIISSTLHNVKCYLTFFHGEIARKKSLPFSVFPSFQGMANLL